MTSSIVVENAISNAKERLETAKRLKKFSLEEIISNEIVRGAVERYLYLAMQASVDLADVIISYKKFRKPTTLSESFLILEENGLIDRELTAKMIKMTGLRNIIAHGYRKIDYQKVYDVLQNRLQDIEQFITKAENLI